MIEGDTRRSRLTRGQELAVDRRLNALQHVTGQLHPFTRPQRGQSSSFCNGTGLVVPWELERAGGAADFPFGNLHRFGPSATTSKGNQFEAIAS
jgi:hypothetical protein